MVDIHEGKVVDAKDVQPIELIKALAKKYKWDISDPSPGCNKCYGRGYEGKFENDEPIPCRCLFRKRTRQERIQDSITMDANTIGRDKKKKLLKHSKNTRLKKF